MNYMAAVILTQSIMFIYQNIKQYGDRLFGGVTTNEKAMQLPVLLGLGLMLGGVGTSYQVPTAQAAA